MARYRSLEVSEVGDLTLARVTERKVVDDVTIKELGMELATLVDERHPSHLVLDFASVRYLSSGMMGNLIGVHRKMKAQGGRMTLREIHPDVFEVFSIARLDRLFEIDNASFAETATTAKSA